MAIIPASIWSLPINAWAVVFGLFVLAYFLKSQFDSINGDAVPWIYRVVLGIVLGCFNKFLNLVAKCLSRGGMSEGTKLVHFALRSLRSCSMNHASI